MDITNATSLFNYLEFVGEILLVFYAAYVIFVEARKYLVRKKAHIDPNELYVIMDKVRTLDNDMRRLNEKIDVVLDLRKESVQDVIDLEKFKTKRKINIL